MSEETSESDRRQYARAPIELKVGYSRMNAFFADYTKNISKGGTFISTDQPLDLNTEFMFQLSIPAMDEPISLRGRVVRVVTLEEAASNSELDPGMGIRFLYKDDEERRSIEKLAEDLMRESLGEHTFRRLMEKSRK
jgi:type IV pilus assembly protein PilZ